MGFNAAHTLTDRFTWLFEGLCRVIGLETQRQRVDAALAWAIWTRVRVLGDRLIALAERVRAGRMARRRGPKATTPHPNPSPQGGRELAAEAATRASDSLAAMLPGVFGWLGRMVPEAARYAGALQYMLRDPEMAALVEEAPQAWRLLRPLCHLLGVRPPDALRRDAGVAQETQAPVAEATAAPPRITPADERAASEGGAGEGSEGASVAPVAQAPPQPTRLSAEEAAAAYARRPGGLYWDGTRMRWS